MYCEESANTGQQLAASPSPCLKWGLGPQSLLGLTSANRPSVSLTSQALDLALFLHTGGDFSSCVDLETQLEVLFPKLLWMVCFLF